MAESKTELSPRRLRRRERNRDALRDAAKVVFERKGYVDATIQDIIDEADVGRGTFYNYFQSKDDVFAELMGRLIDQLITAGTDVGDERSVRRRVDVSMSEMLATAKRNRRLLGAADQAIHVSEDYARLWSSLRTRLEDVISHDLDWCMRHGMIDETDPRVLAHIIAGMVESAILAVPRRGSPDSERVARALVDVYWNAVFRPHEGADDYVIQKGGKPEAVVARRNGR